MVALGDTQGGSGDMQSFLRALESGQIVELPLGVIRPNPKQPRMYFDEGKIKLMAETFDGSKDVSEPIFVTMREENDVMFALIVDGECRWRACKEAELEKVSCRIGPPMTDEEMYVQSALKNFCRTEMSPIEKALAIKKLMKTLGLSQVEVARKVGMSSGTVSNLLKLLKIHPLLRLRINKGELDPGLAVYLVSVPEGRQIDVLEKFLERDRVKKIPANDRARAIQRIIEELGIERCPDSKKRRRHKSFKEHTLLKVFRGAKVLMAIIKDLKKIDRQTINQPLKSGEIHPDDVLVRLEELQRELTEVISDLEGKLN